jgi:hypothetical protein
VNPCSLYRVHKCAVIENHHICPKSWWAAAGKPVNTPMALICPNCHMDVHWAIDQFIHHQVFPVGIPPRCRALAATAFHLAEINGLTPAPTL